MNLISIYELAGCALVLAIYRAYLKDLPNIEYRTTRAEKLSKVQLIQRYIDRIDNEILEPCEELQKSLRNLIQEHTRRSKVREPTVVIPIPKRHRRVNPRLFRYTPRAKVFVRVYRDEKVRRLSKTEPQCEDQARNQPTQSRQTQYQNQPTPIQNQPSQNRQSQNWQNRRTQNWQNRQTQNHQTQSQNQPTQNQQDENEFDMTNLKKLDIHGVNSRRDPYWHPQPRSPLSSVDCNKATRRYPATLYPELKPNPELKAKPELLTSLGLKPNPELKPQ